MKFSTNKKILIGITILALALAGLTWFSYFATRRLLTANQWVTHTYAVIARLADGSTLLTEAETAQRAFLLTSDERFLAESRVAQENVKNWLATLRQLTSDNLEQQQRLARLEDLIQQRLAVLNSRILLRQERGLEMTAAAVASRDGKELMDRVLGVIREMRDAEENFLVTRTVQSRGAIQWSGTFIFLSSTVACLMGLTGVLFIRRDLRRRDEAEQEVRKTRALMESILDNIPAMVFLQDFEGRFLFVNRRLAERIGRPREELIGKSVEDGPTELFAAAQKREMLAEQAPVEFEETISGPDGPRTYLGLRFPVRDAGGKVYAIAGVSTDITARKRAEEERDRFFDVSRDLMCIADFEGRFKTVNPAWQEMLGYTREELCAKPFMEFVHPDDRAATIAETTKLASGGETMRFENRYLARDGSVHWLSWSARSDVPSRLIYASARDVTEQRLAREQITRLNDDLKLRAAQLEAANDELESFSYSVSHDLRAPLRHIDGFVDLLRKNGAEKLDDRGRRYLGIISDSAKQMGALIDDLLVFSRMGRTEMRRTQVDMNSLIEEVRAGLQSEVEGRSIEWNITSLPTVVADHAMMRQVFANLLGNAVKYTRPRNPAKIEVRCEHDVTRNEFIFFVRDNGVGFDMDYVEKLFGVFQRLHRSEDFEGTGIGLANVRRIVHRHGGRTWAEGKVDVGATFAFSLPGPQG